MTHKLWVLTDYQKSNSRLCDLVYVQLALYDSYQMSHMSAIVFAAKVCNNFNHVKSFLCNLNSKTGFKLMLSRWRSLNFLPHQRARSIHLFEFRCNNTTEVGIHELLNLRTVLDICPQRPVSVIFENQNRKKCVQSHSHHPRHVLIIRSISRLTWVGRKIRACRKWRG